MAIWKDLQTIAVVAALTVIVGSVGIYLGFSGNRYVPRGIPAPKVPDQGPILYEMRSVRSEANRVRFEWREIPKAESYRVTVMTAEDQPVFSSADLKTNYWTIPAALRPRLKPQSVYHWKVEVLLESGKRETSEAASFATQ